MTVASFLALWEELKELFTQTMPMADDGTPHETILEDAGSTGRKCLEHGRTVGPSIEESSTSQQSKQADEGTELEQCNIQVGQWFFKFVNHDLFLLENQIPFFIVRKLYELVTDKNTTAPPVTDGIVKYVEAALRFYPKSIQESDRPKDFHHLLHLCHMYFRPSHKPEEDQHYLVAPQYLNRFLSFGRRYLKLGYHPDESEQRSSLNEEAHYQQSGQQLNRWRRAAQYLEAGVKFAKRKFDKADPHSVGNQVLALVRWKSHALSSMNTQDFYLGILLHLSKHVLSLGMTSQHILFSCLSSSVCLMM